MRRFGILILAVLFVSTAACSKEEAPKVSDLPTEMAAKALAQKAQMFEEQDNGAEATKLYKELKEKYGHTKFYAEFSEEMMNKGISIEDVETSRTAQAMFKLQNMMLTYKEEHGFYPTAHAMAVPKDAWGRPVHLDINTKPHAKYEFLIYSIGPDGKLQTDDDIVMVYTGTKSTTARLGDIATEGKQVGKNGEPIPLSDGISLEKVAKLAETGGGIKAEPADDADHVMSIDELKKLSKSSSGSGGGETVKSLDELLKETAQ